jgi:multidrug transporter EmrE-like cation transporter
MGLKIKTMLTTILSYLTASLAIFALNPATQAYAVYVGLAIVLVAAAEKWAEQQGFESKVVK